MAKLSEQFKSVVEKQGESLNLDEMIDIEELIDDLPKLLREISKQPAYIAYALEMKRVVSSIIAKYDKYIDKFRNARRSVAIEHLKFNKNVHITSKMIESKLTEICDKDEKFVAIERAYEKRVKELSYIEMLIEVLRVREQTFKSLTYIMDSAIKTGLMYPRKEG